ncbi:hypothetical protein AB434_3748 [Heyndrickxia coagulans]|nr:hypothetical protein AB434_3748 [Heyndrickxia coagulans]
MDREENLKGLAIRVKRNMAEENTIITVRKHSAVEGQSSF